MPTVQEDETLEKSLAEDEALDLLLYLNPYANGQLNLTWSVQGQD